MSNLFTQRDLIEVQEAVDLSAPLNTSVLPRWQRKMLAAKANDSVSMSPRSKAVDPISGASDRFIPNRGAINFDNSQYILANDSCYSTNSSSLNDSVESNGYPDCDSGFRRGGSMLSGLDSSLNELVEGENPHRILAFKSKAPAPSDGHVNTLKALYSQNKGAAPRVKATRHIPSAPDRVLDAPGLVDDFYMNVLDWSVGNTLAVALGNTVYLWNASTGSINELMSTGQDDDPITSLSWIKEGGNYLAVGTESAQIQLWDIESSRRVRVMRAHSSRITSLDWNAHVLAAGSNDCSITTNDVRIKEHLTSTLAGHSASVINIKWSPDGSLLASGGNDNLVCLWSLHGTGNRATSVSENGQSVIQPLFSKSEHQSGIRALAWAPWQRNLLASGGGLADRTIKTWNTATGSLLFSTDTGSQISSLMFSQHEQELLSAHGYPGNQLTLWKYPSMTKAAELSGHTARALHLACSPDGSVVCSAGADESMRFWRVFGEAKGKHGSTGSSSACSNSLSAAEEVHLPTANRRGTISIR